MEKLFTVSVNGPVFVAVEFKPDTKWAFTVWDSNNPVCKREPVDFDSEFTFPGECLDAALNAADGYLELTAGAPNATIDPIQPPLAGLEGLASIERWG
jgi:hypothetical protein